MRPGTRKRQIARSGAETDFQNPISPGLHPIPGDCPICHEPQWDGFQVLGGEIEDLKLPDGSWTVAHKRCFPGAEGGSSPEAWMKMIEGS